MKWYYGYKEQIRIKPELKSSPLKMGTWWDLFTKSQYSKLTVDEEAEFQTTIDNISDIDKVKLYALANVFSEFINTKTDKKVNTQKEVSVAIENSTRYDKVLGYLDRYDGDIYEVKLSSRPENYYTLENIEMQIGFYFIGCPEAKKATMEVTRVPQLRMGNGETYTTFQNRIEEDIKYNLAKYFIGYNPSDSTYGKLFYRTDFRLDAVWYQVESVCKIIDYMVQSDTWFANTEDCSKFSGCDFFDICRLGIYNEKKYSIKGGE
jgi:hypothetical protein